MSDASASHTSASNSTSNKRPGSTALSSAAEIDLQLNGEPHLVAAEIDLQLNGEPHLVAAEIDLQLNGEPHLAAAPCSIARLLESLQLGDKRVAVAHNGEVVPRSLYTEVELSTGDRIEILEAVGGG